MIVEGVAVLQTLAAKRGFHAASHADGKPGCAGLFVELAKGFKTLGCRGMRCPCGIELFANFTKRCACKTVRQIAAYAGIVAPCHLEGTSMLGIFSDRPVGERENCEVKRDGRIAGDVECQNIATGDREFIGKDAGETLKFGRNLFGILVAIAIALLAGLRDFPVIGLDTRLTVFADHHKLGQRSLAFLINEHFGIAQFFFFPLEFGDPLVNCIDLLVIHFGRFEKLLYLAMFGFNFGNTRLGCFTQWFAVKPCLREFLAVRPG